MQTFDELKKETSQIVLVDTNVIINLEHLKYSKIDLLAISKIFKSGIKPFLTDFSLIELIVGCANLNDFKKHFDELNNMEFCICGFYKPLCKFLSEHNYEQLKNDYEFKKFKEKIIKYRNKIIFNLFESLFRIYAAICVILFQSDDKYYWDKAFFIFTKLSNKEGFKKIIFTCFKNFIDNKKESKNLIKGLFIELLIALLVLDNPIKYKENELRDRLLKLINPKSFSILVKKIGIKKSKDSKNWFINEFIKKTRTLIDKNDIYPVLTDGICYIASSIIFNNANLDTHDFIDILNIYFASTQNIDVHYFSNDKNKWGHFINIEKELRPDIKLFFNK